MANSYRPFIVVSDYNGRTEAWDRYTSAAAAKKAAREDTEVFELVNARVEFRGAYSKYPRQDAEISRLTPAEARAEVAKGWMQRALTELPPGRARNTKLALLQGYKTRGRCEA